MAHSGDEPDPQAPGLGSTADPASTSAETAGAQDAVGAKRPKPTAQELLADWRTAERVGKTARSAAEVAGLAVESANSAKAAATSAQVAVTGAAEAVDRAKEASDSALAAAAQASEAAQLVYAEAQEDVDRTGEIVREADALEADAGDKFREAQREAFAKEFE